jgi:hypothetical protein
MSNPNPHEPLVRNPNTGPAKGLDPGDAQIPDDQDGELADNDQAADDDHIF